MEGPHVTHNDWTEEHGVLAVNQAAVDARSIWRPTPLRDVGIDGQLEYVLDDGTATGRLVAVQIKSGDSHWRRRDREAISFTPEAKHRSYWERHPLPVIVVLHNQAESLTIWANARDQLRDGATTLRVPLTNVLNADGVRAALETAGPLPVAAQPLDEILVEMVMHRHPNPGFRASFLDFFLGGLTDVAKSLYFGMDMVHETQDVLAVLPGGNGRIDIGSEEHVFIDDYVAYLLARDLARIDFDAWRRMARRFEMTGTWISPLTERGEALLEHIRTEHPDLLHSGLIRERLVQMRLDDFDERVRAQQELARRVEEGSRR